MIDYERLYRDATIAESTAGIDGANGPNLFRCKPMETKVTIEVRMNEAELATLIQKLREKDKTVIAE